MLFSQRLGNRESVCGRVSKLVKFCPTGAAVIQEGELFTVWFINMYVDGMNNEPF